MAYMNTTRTASPSIADRLVALTVNFRAAMARRRVYSQTMSELSSLSDRDLRDLGISRAMIAEVANQAAYGK
ncbi:MAG: DUF1127 domain-containing protein [Cypionkella sp.]|nr:DUF1127 domain-containing protein [Cypionkella sp.]